MLRWLLLAFTLVPIIELFVLIQVGQWIGVWPTVAIVLVTGIVGAVLAKAQGLYAVAKLKAAVVQGRLPGRELLHAALVVIGGTLLVTPGVLTDVLGFLLLLPPSRAVAAVVVAAWIKRHVQVHIGPPGAGWPGGDGRPGDEDGEIIDAEYRPLDGEDDLPAPRR